MKDKIRLNQMQFYGYHGVSTAERETGRRFEIDCELEVDLADAGHTDQLADTIDYGRVYEVIRKITEGQAFSLLEGLAQELASTLLAEFPAYRVTLRVRKLHPPIAGAVGSIEVELSRLQGDTSKLLNNIED
jgi:dihydroneopterin aldolase